MILNEKVKQMNINIINIVKYKIKNSSRFTKNILVLLTGSSLAQLLSFAFSTIISRIYTPQEYGSVAVFNAYIAIIAVVVTGQYATAIMLDEDLKNAKNTWTLCLIISISVSIVVFIIAAIYAYFITPKDDLTRLFVFLLPFQVFTNGIINANSVWNNKNKVYKTISKLAVFSSIITFISNFIFGIIGLGAKGLLLSGAVSQVISALLSMYYICRKTEFLSYISDLRTILKQAIKHINFPKYNIIATLLGTASTQFPIILFSYYYNAHMVGGYSRAVQVINLPMSLIGNAIGNVFFKEATDIEYTSDKTKLKEFVYATYKRLLFIGIIPMAFIFGYGDIIFPLVFGQSWTDAGRYAQILAPWFVFVFVTSPISTLLYIKGKQKQNTIISLVFIISRVFIIVVTGTYGLEFSISLVFFTLTGVIIWIFVNSYILRLVEIPFSKSAANAILRITASFLVVVAPRLINYLIMECL